jgi:hypothetical protein
MKQAIEWSHDMSRQAFFAVLSGAAITLSAITLAQAAEMPSYKHGVATTRHVPTKTLRHSYARMPVESEAPSPVLRPAPNLFETGHPPAQPGQW